LKYFFSPRCLEYGQQGHPESPERVLAIYNYLKKKNISFIEPTLCRDEDIIRVHSFLLLEKVRNGQFIDLDTPALPNIYEYARLSAGGAILALQSAVTGEMGFSLMRPPGHHATKNSVMGFCYFNNIAIATARFLADDPSAKAAILDIDCHHGNGTEDIFKTNPSVLYVSLHQSPLYPGTGLESGENVLNYPLPPGTGEPEYLKTLEIACEKIEEFKPDVLGISAGFDTFEEDPLTQMMLKVETYNQIGKLISRIERPTFIVLEGGYSTRLPQCVDSFINGLKS